MRIFKNTNKSPQESVNPVFEYTSTMLIYPNDQLRKRI